MLKKLALRIGKQQLKLEVTKEAKDLIVERGYDVTYGARPLKRFIESKIETAVAIKILGGDIQEGQTLTVAVSNGQIIVL